jgi:hypothetical protein
MLNIVRKKQKIPPQKKFFFLSFFMTFAIHKIFNKPGTWAAMLVARLRATALWVRILASLIKYKMGDISKGVANTL